MRLATELENYWTAGLDDEDYKGHYLSIYIGPFMFTFSFARREAIKRARRKHAKGD